jgi:hypothetical protein
VTFDPHKFFNHGAPVTETPYEKNTREQYEALGRFVEAFEEMVLETRTCCLDLLTFGLSQQRRKLVAIPLYYDTLGAKAVFDIFRAVFIETISDQEYQTKHGLAEAEVREFSSVLSKINGHYNDLSNRRNDLLHGTWFVGLTSVEDKDGSRFEDKDGSRFYVRRLRVSGKGLSEVPLPTTVTELIALRDQCWEVRTWISTIHACLPLKAGKPFNECFEYRDQQWYRLWPLPITPLATKP